MLGENQYLFSAQGESVPSYLELCICLYRVEIARKTLICCKIIFAQNTEPIDKYLPSIIYCNVLEYHLSWCTTLSNCNISSPSIHLPLIAGAASFFR